MVRYVVLCDELQNIENKIRFFFLQDEYAYIDAEEAEVQMISSTSGSDNFDDEKAALIMGDKNDYCGSASSSGTDFYQHFSSAEQTRYNFQFTN